MKTVFNYACFVSFGLVFLNGLIPLVSDLWDRIGGMF